MKLTEIQKTRKSLVCLMNAGPFHWIKKELEQIKNLIQADLEQKWRIVFDNKERP